MVRVVASCVVDRVGASAITANVVDQPVLAPGARKRPRVLRVNMRAKRKCIGRQKPVSRRKFRKNHAPLVHCARGEFPRDSKAQIVKNRDFTIGVDTHDDFGFPQGLLNVR